MLKLDFTRDFVRAELCFSVIFFRKYAYEVIVIARDFLQEGFLTPWEFKYLIAF